mgnify:CR=1 FL=1
MEYYEFFVGQHFRKENSEDRYSKIYQPVAFVRHPGYNVKTINNDICLIFTAGPIEYNAGVTPARVLKLLLKIITEKFWQKFLICDRNFDLKLFGF